MTSQSGVVVVHLISLTVWFAITTGNMATGLATHVPKGIDLMDLSTSPVYMENGLVQFRRV